MNLFKSSLDITKRLYSSSAASRFFRASTFLRVGEAKVARQQAQFLDARLLSVNNENFNLWLAGVN
jgi:hypothetical protein